MMRAPSLGCSNDCSWLAGDLATLFMLEDRVTVRTNAGQDTNEFDPTGGPAL